MSKLKSSARSCHNALIRARGKVRPTNVQGLGWLFMATLPNAGSTAIAKMLETADNVHTLHRSGEGQWLVPQMSVDRLRWLPEHELDYELIRAVWLHHAWRRSHGKGGIVFDKSPPNLVRMKELVATFSDMPVQVLVLTRDPLAICASWAKRYPPEAVAREWLQEDRAHLVEAEDGYYRTLGSLCGERMTLLAELRATAACILSYERFTEEPEVCMREIKRAIPSIGWVDVGAKLAVKDYEPQTLRNMNNEQTQRLSEQQRVWVAEGLEPHTAALAAFGYRG